jgi:hypothetical protein
LESNWTSSGEERLLMEPLNQAIKRAALLLANIHASRREAIPKAEPVKAIRQEEDFAVVMGMSPETFRQQVVSGAFLRLFRTEDDVSSSRSERYELENTLLKMLGRSRPDTAG